MSKSSLFNQPVISLKPFQKEALEGVRELFLKHSLNKVERCPLCSEEVTEKTKPIAKYDVYGLPCEVLVCSACGFLFQRAPLASSGLAENYSKFSYLLRGKSRKIDKPPVNHFNLKRKTWVTDNFSLQKEDLIVELGCSYGGNLIPFKNEGYDCLGFDLDEKALEIGREAGLEMIEADALNFREKLQRSPKVIILSHFLEHIGEPYPVIRECWEALPMGGALYIEVPGFRHSNWVSERGGITPYWDFEHLLYFDRITLTYLLESEGFEVIAADDFVCEIFRKVEKPKEIIQPKANDSYRYLIDVEKNYSRSFRGIFKNIIRRLKNI